MLGQKLFALARLCGMNQAAVARQLGIDKQLANFWATGARPISRAFRTRAVAVIFAGAKVWAQTLAQMSPEQVCQAYGATTKRQLLRRALRLSIAVRLDNLRAAGLAAGDSAGPLLEEVAAIQQRAQAHPTDASVADELEAVTAKLHALARVGRDCVLLVGLERELEDIEQNGRAVERGDQAATA